MAKPSILWLSLESVRADHTSLYGYDRQTTPFLESLSQRADSEIIDPMVAASMWTPASTASLLTGTHMSTHQVGQDGMGKTPIPSSIKTLPELLSDIGYQTGLFAVNPYIGPETGLNRGFDYIPDVGIGVENFISPDSIALDSTKTALRCLTTTPTLSPARLKEEIGRSGNDLLEFRVSRWLDSNISSDDPFFGYVHIQSPHHPYKPTNRFLREFISELDISASDAINRVNEIYDGINALRHQMAEGLNFSDETWRAIETLYDAEIRHTDHTVKKIIRKAEKEVNRPLIIIIVGDHGELFGEYGLIGHNLVLHDGVIRVPGLVIGIDNVKDSQNTVTQHIDLTHTVASITGVLNSQFQGRDIRDPERPYAISQRGMGNLENYTKYSDSFDSSMFFQSPFTSVRTTEYKLLSNETQTLLYNLPDEEDDVSDEQPDIVPKLQKYLNQEKITWSELGQEQIEYDESTVERLRELGYLQ